MNLKEFQEEIKDIDIKVTDYIRENLTPEEMLKITNEALDKLYSTGFNTNHLKQEMNISWNALKGILKENNIVFSNTLNQVISTKTTKEVQFTEEEIEKLKELLNANLLDRLETVEEGFNVDMNQLSFQIALAKENGELTDKSSNKTFNVDEDVYTAFSNFTKRNPNKTKDIISLFILEGIKKYNKK